jgi:hypothetical protein
MSEPEEQPPEKESATTGRKQRLFDSSAARFPRQERSCFGICAEIKQRVSIPSLWRYHNLLGDPVPGRRCRSPFYHDKNPDFFISRDGDWFVDHGEPSHKGDVISFEMLASGCTRGDAIRKLRELASLPKNGAHRLPVNARLQSRQYQDSGQLRPMTLDFLERGSGDDLERLAELRRVAREGLKIACDAGALWFATLKGVRAWIVTDRNRYVAEARRLDGKSWDHIGGAKTWTLPGGTEGRKKWPLGILEAQNSRAIALVEGSADFIAAFHWIWAEGRRDVIPAAMLGACLPIHAVALPFFANKRVRIFPHYDADRFNGIDAALRWSGQLRQVGATVDCFDFTGLRRSDDRAVSDLNDLCLVSYEQWQNEACDIMP